MSTLTELYAEELLREKARSAKRDAELYAKTLETYRTGDLMHNHLGDIQVACRDCHGVGKIPQNPPFGSLTSCDTCCGRGYVWREPPLKPEEYEAEIDRLRGKLARYETTLQLIASQPYTSTARACVNAAKAALDPHGGELEGTG